MRKQLKRRDFLRISASLAAGAAVVGCSQQPPAVPQPQQPQAEQTSAPEEPLISTPVPDVETLSNAAMGVPYIQKSSINGGKPIEIEHWEWAADRAEYEKEWADEYMKMYPNVKITVLTQSFADHFNKFLVNAPAGQGPALLHMHLDYQTTFCNAQVMEPIPPSVADIGFLKNHWFGFEEGIFSCANDSIAMIPMGAQLPMLFINEALWNDAGLTESDIPKDYEQLREVAKKLTKVEDGKIVQAGFMANWTRLIKDMILQQGRYLFTSDKQKAQLINDQAYNAIKFISDMYHVDKVTDPGMPGIIEAFSSGVAAMVWEESWMISPIRRNNPDLKWIGALSPTWTGKLEPTVGHMHFAVESIVNSFASAEQKEVAWDYFHFLYSSDERLARTIAVRNGMVPSYDKLAKLDAVQNDPVIKLLVDGMDYGVMIGGVPSFYYQQLQALVVDPVTLESSTDIHGALQAAEGEINNLLSQRTDWNILERKYKYDKLMISDQP